jgi:hypothetical protein
MPQVHEWAPHDRPEAPDTWLEGYSFRFGYSYRLGGIGTVLEIGGHNVIQSRFAAGAALQTAFGWTDDQKYWFANQRAGNSGSPHWAYPNIGNVPLWPDQAIWVPDGHAALGPGSFFYDLIEPVEYTVAPSEPGSPRAGDTLTSRVTLVSQVPQQWTNWFAEAAFYTFIDIGGTLELTFDDGRVERIALGTPGQSRHYGDELARARIVWPFGWVEVDAPLGGWLAWDRENGNVAWHTFLSGNLTHRPVSFYAGETRTYTVTYRIGGTHG